MIILSRTCLKEWACLKWGFGNVSSPTMGGLGSVPSHGHVGSNTIQIQTRLGLAVRQALGMLGFALVKPSLDWASQHARPPARPCECASSLGMPKIMTIRPWHAQENEVVWVWQIYQRASGGIRLAELRFFFYHRVKEVRWKKKIKGNDTEELGKKGKVDLFLIGKEDKETIVERK